MSGKAIRQILAIMEDGEFTPGRTPMHGAMMAQADILGVDSGFMADQTEGYETQPEQNVFTDLELRIARRFMQLVGGPERARDLLNKCDECEECLGLVDDYEEEDTDTIANVAGMVPDDVDMPTHTDLSALYNPSAIAKPI